MKRRELYLVIAIIMALFLSFALSRFVISSEKEIVVLLKDAKISKTDIIIDPTEWTKDKVSTSINNEKGGETYYKIGENGEWTKYDASFDIYENCTLYTKIVYNDGEGPETVKEISNIDKVEPKVTLTPNGEECIINSGEENTVISVKIFAEDEVGELKDLKYAWSTSNTEEPTEWLDFTNNEPIENIVSSGTYYLWTNVTDKVGNISTNVSNEYNVKYEIKYDANNGQNAPQAQSKSKGEPITLSTDEPTRVGYTFLGWATSNSASVVEYYKGGVYSEDVAITLYAVWSPNNYQNTTTGTYYPTLKSAFDEVETGEEIKVLESVTETETPVLETGKNAILNLNNQTTTLSSVSLTNNANLTIKGESGTITGSGADTIKNTGTLLKDTQTEIANTSTADYYVINNSGIATISAGTINGNYKGIYNDVSGKVEVTGGTLTARAQVIRNYGSANTESSPAVKISGNPTLIGTERNTVVNDATATGLIYIDGGILNSTNAEVATPTVLNSGNGKILITSGTIQSSGTNAVVYNGYNSGNAAGTIEIRGGTIESDTAVGVVNNEKANIIISGGSISGTIGIHSNSTGTVTIGTNETTPSVSVTEPTIYGKSYGVKITGKLNFYDGKIQGPTGQSINGTVSAVPSGYTVVTTNYGTTEISVLGPSAPVITAKLTDANGATYTSGTWTNKDIYISLKSANVGAGIKEYQRYLNGTWTKSNITTSNNVGTISFAENINETVKFRAVDNNGVISQESSIVLKRDSTAPTVTLTEDSNTSYANAIKIDASDNVNIQSYGISTSASTQPTTWINVNSVDLTGVQTKVEYGATWARVFYHNNVNGSVLFTSDSEVLSCDTRYKYSILGKLDNFKNSSGKFEFLLQYPNTAPNEYNRWIQTGNPVTTTVANGDGSANAPGYEAIHVDWTEKYWGGLTKSTDNSTYINGSVGYGSWYYAIGSKAKWKDGIPGKDANAAERTVVELWVRIDNLPTANKKIISTKIGNIKTNGTYYVWVKDHIGNITSKSITTTKVDTTGPTVSLASSNTNPTNANVTLTATASDAESGLYSTAYSWQGDNSWGSANTYTATANGTYTVYVRNNIGKITSKSITVSNIDKVAPTVLINTESMYVTDGIVTRLDGVNNTNGSHSSSATTWSDISGNAKNGTITSGTWGANYLQFNGSSSWVNLGQMNSDYKTIDVTFSANALSTTSSQTIIGNFEAGGGGIYINTKGYIVGEYYVNSAYRTITSPVKVEVGKVYNVSITYNGTTVILYVNGIEQGRISNSGTIGVPANSTVMALGTNPGGSSASGGYFNGKIYSAGVYNKALTAAQVKTNADAGKALAGGPTNASSITYTMRFSENVTGFTTDDITITNGTKGTFATVTSGRVFTVAVTTATNQNNTQTIALAANGCTDAAGNGLAATNKTVVIDRVAPTVTLSTNGGTYNIAPGNTTVSISTTLTVADTGSGVTGLGYAWATSNSSQPSSWTTFTSGTAISASRSGGNSYIWTNVIDNAGNRATSVLTSNAFVVRYQVVFNANSGSGAPGTQYKVHGTTLTLSSTKPTRTGYTFKEWNTKSDGTGTSYAAGASYTANSAVTLYAIWIEVPSAPVITAKLTNASGATYTSGTWTNKDIYISLESANKGAGIKEYQWKEGSDGTWKAISNSDGTGTWSAERNSTIYFRAVDTNGGISAESSIDMKIDKAAPTMTSAEIKNVTATGYDVYIYGVKDAGSGVNRVQFPTWTSLNGQDDIQSNWVNSSAAKGTKQADGTTWVYRVNTTAHKNESGTYYTHIYVYDNLGNSKHISTHTITVPNVTVTYDYNYMDNDIYGNKPLTTNFSSAGVATGTTSRADNSSAKYGNEIRYTVTKAGTGGAHISPGRLTVGKTYTWSVYIKASKNITINLGQEQGGVKQVNLTTSWQRFTHTFTAQNTTYNSFVFYSIGGNSGSWAVGDVMYMHSLELKETPTLNITTQSKAYNTALGTLPSTSRTGYTFQGWYTAPVGGTKITSTTTTPATNTTYYAHWTANNYTVTYNYNGTKNYIAPKAQSITATGFSGTTNKCFDLGTIYLDDLQEGDKLTISFDASYSNLTSASGQTAALWFQGKGNSTAWSPGFPIGTKVNWTGTGTATYTYTTAAFSATNISNDYFNAQIRTDYYSGGIITISNIKVIRTTTKTVTKPYATQLGTLPSPSEVGYTLKGWYTAKTGGTAVSSTTTVTGNVTYYAQWTANNYLISYKFNDVGNDMSLWKNNYPDRFTFSYSNTTGMNNIDLYGEANYEIVYIPITTEIGKTYKISFDYQNITGYEPLTSDGIAYQALTKVENSPNLDNSLATRYLKTTAMSTAEKLSLEFVATTNTTYLAFNFGLAKDYQNITVKLGNFEITKQLRYGGTLGTLPSPSEVGYTLKGWYTAKTGGTAVSSTTTVTGNATYYAQWTTNVYTMTLNNQSATSAGSTAFYVKYNTGYYKESGCTTSITSITVPTKTNWIFQGYYTATNGGGTKIIDSSGKITSNMSTTKFSSNQTLYAYWITNYQNTTTGKYYLHIYDALNEINNSSTNSHTIKVLRSFADAYSSSSNLNSGKTLTLELGGFTVGSGGYIYINNEGSLTVNGTGTLESVVSSNASSFSGTINNSGTLTVTGNATIKNKATSLNGCAISNSGAINLTKATINGNIVGIYNNKGSGSTVTISNVSSVTGTNVAGIYNGGIITNNGKISGADGVRTDSNNSSSLTITGTGTISGTGTSSDYAGIKLAHSSSGIIKDGINISGYNGILLNGAATTTISGSTTKVTGTNYGILIKKTRC